MALTGMLPSLPPSPLTTYRAALDAWAQAEADVLRTPTPCVRDRAAAAAARLAHERAVLFASLGLDDGETPLRAQVRCTSTSAPAIRSRGGPTSGYRP